ncbi:G5 domain-containing protein [Candidatus Saccharibacteria bacterium]|nr:G5 domain-containing protein [Candidatus Saccharibacteria bacterium]
MKLSRKIEQALGFIVAISLVIIFAVVAGVSVKSTFAEGDGEQSTYLAEGAKFVTFYDNGEKLTVKTEAKTVKEAIERAGIVVNDGDKVEPGLDTEINADNFFINIYRARPVIIKDGKITKYLMTASYNMKTIASEAGLLIYDGDEIEFVPNEDFLETGVANVYKITRNGGRTLTIEEEIPFIERTEKDYNLDPGVSEVRQLGEVGMKKLSYNVLYVDNVEVSRELISEEITKEPVERIVAVGASAIERSPLTVGKGRNNYTYTKSDGTTVLRQETYYDLNMAVVMSYCGGGGYTVRSDGVKVDKDGYVLVAANLGRYPRCSVVETSLGPGKVYDTGGFAAGNPEQFDLATDWSNSDGV